MLSLHNYAQYGDLVTLNGWLRIVPPEICKMYNLVNGHPGLITRYPELKGIDPQKRFWTNKDKYEYYGSVVHEVTAEVDEGRVLSFSEKKVDGTEEEPFEILKNTSLNAWLVIFGTHLIIDRYSLAKHVAKLKNFLAPRSHWPQNGDLSHFGYCKKTPDFLAMWLLIITDNTLHLMINFLSLKYL